jgi:hypothetical protein
LGEKWIGDPINITLLSVKVKVDIEQIAFVGGKGWTPFVGASVDAGTDFPL